MKHQLKMANTFAELYSDEILQEISILTCNLSSKASVMWKFKTLSNQEYIDYIHHFQVLPAGLFSSLFTTNARFEWLRVLARPLQVVQNGFLSETLSCALS